jgi:hypothetical protein
MVQIFNSVGAQGIAAQEVVAPPRRTDQYDSSSLLLLISRAPCARGTIPVQSIPAREPSEQAVSFGLRLTGTIAVRYGSQITTKYAQEFET